MKDSTLNRILMVDADSKNDFPNLALMKISAWRKSLGDRVDLMKGIPSSTLLVEYDHVYISCIFYQNRNAVLDYASHFPKDQVSIGGSGIDLKLRLDNDIEHIMPDYEIYGLDYSLGYTSRGCIRKCKWCVVPEKEGSIHDHASISEFLDPNHDSVILLDNNFQSSPNWRENLDFLIANKIKVNFNQGLDVRLLTKEFVDYLSELKFYDWHFKKKHLHFAFDQPAHEKAVRRGIKMLGNVGIKPYRLMFYVLVGFNTNLDQDLHRIHVLKELGAYPYVMRYNNIRTKELNKLARWVNRRYYQWIPYEKYTRELG